MKINIVIYYAVLFAACALSVIRIKHDRRLLVFSILLICSLVEELLFEYLEDRHIVQYCFFIYHLFAPIYYSLFAYYFSSTLLDGKPKKWIRLSIPFFVVVTLSISILQNGFNDFPGLQLNIMGVLLIIDSLIVLFQLDVRDRTPLFRRPIFWIGMSTLFFYASLFSLNGFFNYLHKHDLQLANELNKLLNNNLNYLYYLLIVIGMLCSKYVHFQASVTQHFIGDGDAEIDIIDSSNNHFVLSSGSDEISTPLYMYPGTYKAKASTTFSNEYAQISVQYTQHLYSKYMHIKAIGGSRINRISYYDNITNTTPSKISRFVYRVNDTLSSGQGSIAPQYADYEYTPQASHADGGGKAGDWEYYVMHSTSLVTLGRTQGSNVGYSKVTMLHGDSGQLGSEVFQYSLDHLGDIGGIGYPYTPSTSLDDLRGLLLEHDVYDSAGTIVEATNNNYGNLTAYTNNKYVEGLKAGIKRSGLSYDIGGCPDPIGGPMGWELQFNEYQMYQFLPQLLSLTDTKYDINGDSLRTVTKYVYDTSTFLLTHQSTFSSKGDSLNVTNKYPKDFAGTAVCDSMVARHILNPVIETDQYKNDSLISKLIDDYQVWSGNNNMIVPLDKKLQKGSDTLETRLQYYNYDNYNNLLEQSKTGDVHEVYLWGYNHEYPVAKILGSSYATVSAVINQAILDSPSSDAALRTELNKLRTDVTLKGSLVTTYTYSPLIGMTSQTDAAGRTNYYEYDNLSRLKLIRDQNGNIIKRYKYKYAGQ